MTADAGAQRVRDAAVTASGVVIGAPGTGKTHTLAARLVALVSSGQCRPEEVLALTPTRQAATVLRDRVGVQLAVATPGALARSMGSFAFQIVRSAALVQGEAAPALLTGADQDRLLAEMLEETGEPELAAPWPAELSATVRGTAAFRAELRGFLAECTEQGVSSSALRASDDPAWRAAGEFLDDYRTVLAGMRAAYRDASDLLAEAAAILRAGDEALLGPLAQLRVVLIDDAQELTRGGVTLVRALRARGVAVLAFGDPDISSGAFRGASPELFAELATLLGEVWVLDHPHRQAPALTRLTRTLTQAIGVGGRVEHRRPPGSEGEASEGVQVHLLDSPFAEFDRIAGVLRDAHLSAGLAWDQMAVIAHDTRQVIALERELAARSVPTRAAGVPRPLGDEAVVRDISGIIGLALTDPAAREPADIGHALRCAFGGLDAVGLRRLRARLRQHELDAGGSRPAGELLREAMANPALLTLIDAPEARQAERMATTLADTARGAAAGESAHELLWRVWDRARAQGGGRLDRRWRDEAEAGSAEAGRALDALVALFDAAKRFGERSPDEQASVFFHGILDADVPEDTLSAPERPGVVRVMTPATALGTESELVVVAGVQDGIWPNVRLRGGLLRTWRLSGDAEALDRRRAALHDELRLFVRAVSRARRQLVVTAVADEDHTPSAFLDFLPEPVSAHPASDHPLTLRGLVARHRRTLTAAASPDARATAAAQLRVLAREGVAGADPQQWYGMRGSSAPGPLGDPAIRPVRVSPSRMEGFERCALDWVIRHLGGDTSTAAAGVGTVVHRAMEEAPGGGRAELARVVEEHWGELEFEADWIAERERRRADVLIGRLDAYLGRVQREGGRVLGAETAFELEIDLDAEGGPAVVAANEVTEGHARARLAGVIDRVEIYPPGRGEDVPQQGGEGERAVIADLKTGKYEQHYLPAHVTDHAQLGAYQLAFSAGAIAGTEGMVSGGSRLIVIGRDPRKNEHYYIAQQQPFDQQEQSAFLARIGEDARGMAAAEFLARIDTHCLSENYAVCRIHTIGSVSAP